jgi:hypothetical protein
MERYTIRIFLEKTSEPKKNINHVKGNIKLKNIRIESVIREHLRNNNIDIKTFKLNYYKVRNKL